MKRHPSTGLEPLVTKASRARPTALYPARRPWGCGSSLSALMAALAVLMFLVLATLASGFIVLGSNRQVGRIVARTPWPTFTPMAISAPQVLALAPADAGSAAVDPAPTPALPTATPTPWPTFTSAPVSAAGGGQVTAASNPPPATPTATSPAPTVAPTATATSAPQPPTPTSPAPPPPPLADTNPATDAGNSDWSFAGTRVETQPARKLMLVFGELTNNTGTTQKLSQVKASFFDGQGNVLMADKGTTGLWPTRVIAAGERVPFALTIRGAVEAASFELAVDAQRVDNSPRQDFEFLGINERSAGSQFCLTGGLQNPEAETARSVVVAAILYDAQGNLLRLGTDVVAVVEAGQSANFEVCLNSLPENPARYEVRAWGS